MEWHDCGTVLGIRKHGETSVILDMLTHEHGRHLGLVQGGRSRRMRPCLQPGNAVVGTWRSRTEEQLGTYVVEPLVQRTGRIMQSALTLNAVNHLCAMTRLLPEREPHTSLHDWLERILDRIDERDVTAAAIVRFEVTLLAELGFGLDLERCAATGTQEDLVYVSPKSGRAVSRAAGEPYHARMLALPGFLLNDSDPRSEAEVLAGFRLAEHFLMRDVFTPRGLGSPEARGAYLRAFAPA